MKGVLSTIGGLVLVVALLVGLIYGGSYLGLDIYERFGTKREDIRTDIYRNNKSYVEGTVRDLRNLRKEYVTADEEHKGAIRSLILHRVGELDRGRLPSDLRSFLKEID